MLRCCALVWWHKDPSLLGAVTLLEGTHARQNYMCRVCTRSLPEVRHGRWNWSAHTPGTFEGSRAVFQEVL